MMGRTTLRWTLALTLLIVLAGAMGVFSDEPEIGVHVGQKAPDFTLPVVGGDDETMTLSEQVAQYDVILLYFFFAAT